MLWIGERLSNLERLSIASFLANGHAVHLYTYGDVDRVPPGVVRCDANKILPESAVFTYAGGFGKGSPSAFANGFRYKLLLERGGMYSDTDIVCLRPFAFAEEMPYAVARPALRSSACCEVSGRSLTSGSRSGSINLRAPSACWRSW